MQEIAYTWYQGYNAAVSMIVIERYSHKASILRIIIKILHLRAVNRVEYHKAMNLVL